VGIDSEYGKWNAPCNPNSGDFVYVPIPENNRVKVQYEKPYSLVNQYLGKFSKNNYLEKEIRLPSHLQSKFMHLDPDFKYLTYGDDDKGRGRRLSELNPGDFVVFYASFNPIVEYSDNLVYGLIGYYEVEEVLNAYEVKEDEFDHNAHTRKEMIYEHDLVLRGKAGSSGRFSKLIPVGEYRERAYRVKKDILDEWGGIGIKNGFIQKNNPYPWFNKPNNFLSWLDGQEYKLLQRNN
jgi:hypothetical protein